MEALETYLGAVLRVLDVGVLVTDARGRHVYLNPAGQTLLGVTSEEFLGRRCARQEWDVVTTDGHAVPLGALPPAVALASGEQAGALLGFRQSSGGRRWLRCQSALRRDEAGQVLCVVTSLVDVGPILSRMSDGPREQPDVAQPGSAEPGRAEPGRAEPGRAEPGPAEPGRAEGLLLAEREARFAELLAAVAEGVIVYDPAGRICDVNPSACEILGRSREDIIGRGADDPIWRLTDEGGRPLEMTEVPCLRAMKRGEVVRGAKISVCRPDGRLAWLLVNASPLGPDGGTVATITDVTAGHLAQAALERTLAQTELLLNALPGSFLYLAEKTSEGEALATFVTPGASALIGVGPDDVPLPLAAIHGRVHPDDWPAVEARLLDPDPVGRDVQLDLRLRAGDSAPWRWATARARPEAFDGGLRWTGTVLDIDEHRQLADRAKQSQKLEAVGVLAEGVAHNFNNLLAAILPNVDHARALATPEARPFLDDAARAADEARRLVRQLMLVGRRLPEAPQDDVDLAALLSQVVDLLRRTWAPTIAIEIELEPKEAWVRGSFSQLHQALLSLCMNARDALDGRSRPKLRVQLFAPDGDSHRILVEDNGHGMAPEVLGRLGEPFFTTKGPDRGTGLGVATSMGLLRDHGGTLAFSSALGEGTRVTITLPSSQPPLASVPTPQPGRDRSELVMVVDDEPLVRRALARQIHRAGYRVTEVESGEAALEQLRSGPVPDAMLVDINMPKLSGVEVLAEVSSCWPTIPVILMSGLPYDPGPAAAAVLQKPMERRTLLDAIDRVFGR